MNSYMETQYHHHHHHHHHHDQPNINTNTSTQTQEQPTSSSSTAAAATGLLRFRSAPTTIFDDVTTTQNGYSGSGSGSGSGGLPPQHPKLVKKSRKGRDSSIDRLSSSPPGFFHSLIPHNGYTMMTGTGNGGTHSESSNRLRMSHLAQISEFGPENIKETNSKGIYFGNHEDAAGFESGLFSFSSWNDSSSEVSHPSENGRLGPPQPNVLAHMSLPRTSAEIAAAAEKLAQFQDTVGPWKIRAKRGHATHPRSIAERVRRNRISEKMRKLQCLVPSMDKQANTADMLDLAVEYIRNLQNQHKVLSNVRARCKCAHLKHSVANQATQ